MKTRHKTPTPRGRGPGGGRTAIVSLLFAIAAFAFGSAIAQTADTTPAIDTRPRIHWLEVNGIITHGTAAFVDRGIARAEEAGATAVVIELDTPGGVVDSTRDIVKSQLNARIPVVVWVGPRGARAGSAGVFITLAANVAAMAPGSNIGAAHPIGIGEGPPGEDEEEEEERKEKEEEKEAGKDGKNGVRQFKFWSDRKHLARKIENDTVAWVEAIARERDRNVDWARAAVLDSVSVTAEEALKLDVIDLIASDQVDLLQKLDGRVVRTAAGDATIRSANAAIVGEVMTRRELIVSFLANPTLIAILGMVVMLGIYAEFNHPGLIFPAVIAGLSLVALLVGAQVVPINIAALLLIAIGFICFILEIKITSYGLLTIGGIAAVLLGLVMLVDETVFTVGIAWSTVLPALATTAAIMMAITYLAVKAMASKPLGDTGELVGRIVRAAGPLAPTGKVVVDGVFWNAISTGPVPDGGAVRITGSEGLLLNVEPEKS